MTEQIRQIMSGCPFPVVPTAKKEDEPIDENDPYLDGTMLVRELTKDDAAKLGLPEPPIQPEGTFVYHEQGFSPDAVATLLNKEEVWRKLFESIDYSKRAKPHDVINFVFEFMGVPPHRIDPENVPSAGALQYLKDCQDDPATRSEYRKNVYPKIIPDKKQLEHEGKQRDDGRQFLSRLDSFDAEFEEEEANILKMEGAA